MPKFAMPCLHREPVPLRIGATVAFATTHARVHFGSVEQLDARVSRGCLHSCTFHCRRYASKAARTAWLPHEDRPRCDVSTSPGYPSAWRPDSQAPSFPVSLLENSSVGLQKAGLEPLQGQSACRVLRFSRQSSIGISPGGCDTFRRRDRMFLALGRRNLQASTGNLTCDNVL